MMALHCSLHASGLPDEVRDQPARRISAGAQRRNGTAAVTLATIAALTSVDSVGQQLTINAKSASAALDSAVAGMSIARK
jgi:hypothetical protein